MHAHPDDETINNGVTMAKYVDEGAQVTLVTCTLGEEGEVLVPELEHLASDKEDGLGQHRITELDAAMQELGVTDYRFLGGPGRYRDTGMIYDDKGNAAPPPDPRPDTFWRTDLLIPTDDLVKVIRETRPQVLITYDEFGAYGHPDHIQAHRVATYAAHLAAVPSYKAAPSDEEGLGDPWEIAKIYWNAWGESGFRESLRRLRDAGDMNMFEGLDPDGDLPPFITPDRYISATIDGSAYIDRKMNAMKAHATQITVDGPFFALSNNAGNEIWAREEYRLVKGTQAPDDSGTEHDLFAGL